MSIFANLFEDSIRNISGGLGRRLRRAYYRRTLGSCGTNLIIETGVYFDNKSDIHIGDNVWIDRSCILVAGELAKKRKKIITNDRYLGTPGGIHIGNDSHIGIGTIIQGHGGVQIGHNFTSSAHCKIYSLSNDVRTTRAGTLDLKEESNYTSGPVTIGSNVWLGIAVTVISTDIADDVFIRPHSVVYKPIEKNTIAAGNPAAPVEPRFNS